MGKRKVVPVPDLPPGNTLGDVLGDMLRDTGAAAAVLLPVLDAEGAAGHEPSLRAALLIRALLGGRAAVRPAGEGLPDAVLRLAVLVREQDGQIARLHAMLDALL